MSEYQYYEFLAIDRPLTSEEMSDLRLISSRAQITPVSLSNFYNFGDFKGDPDKLMQQYFDAHVYTANWMTAFFKLRIPIEALSQEAEDLLEESEGDVLEYTNMETHCIITWSLHDSENYSRFEMEDGEGWMARLAPIRDELLRGDLRSLYLGWLADSEEMDDDELEPVSVSCLGTLTPAQQALAEFIEIDPDLIAAAALGSLDIQDQGPTEQDKDAWIESLPRDEVAAVLKLLLEGEGQKAERTFKNQFTAWQRDQKGPENTTPLRSLGEIRENLDIAQKKRLQKEKLKREEQEAKRRQKREAYLKDLSKNFPRAWDQIQYTLNRGSGLAYDEACQALLDLSEAYTLVGRSKSFELKLNEFMTAHQRRKAFVERLKRAKLWRQK